MHTRNKLLSFVVLIAPVLISAFLFLLFSLNHLSKFTVADEQLWKYERIPQYWKAFRDKAWKKTRINDKPGVTLAAISGIGFISKKNLTGHPKDFEAKKPDPQRSDTAEGLNYFFRIPIIIFNFLMIFFFFWALLKITGNKLISALASILIALSPILIGISQIINPDALLWSTSLAAFLSFFAHLKTREKKFTLFGSLFLALAILSKYTATIFYPFFFIMAVSYFFLDFDLNSNGLQQFRKKMLENLLNYYAVLGGSLLFFTALMPAVFVDHSILIRGTFGYPGLEKFMLPIYVISALLFFDLATFRGKLSYFLLKKTQNFFREFSKIIYIFLTTIFLLILANWTLGSDFLHLSRVPFDITFFSGLIPRIDLFQKILVEFKIIVFSIPPFLLLSLLFVWTASLGKRMPNYFLIFSLSLFLITYYFAVIYKDLLATIRYSIMLYPLLSILGAIGINEFFQLKYFKKINRAWIYAGVLFLSIFSLYLIQPFYFNYTNDLLPKRYSITDSWGYGGYEAAQYLNTLPNAEKMTVWSDYYGVCDFFVGRCTERPHLAKTWEKFDYYSLTRRGLIRKKDSGNEAGAWTYYFSDNPAWKLEIDQRPGNYLKIYKAQNIN